MNLSIPTCRVKRRGAERPNGDGRYVVYWMRSARRGRYNYALQHARDLALATDRPLLVVETLQVDQPWASDRSHRFAMEGMQDNSTHFAQHGVAYHGYVERRRGAAQTLVERLATHACAIVTDRFLPGEVATSPPGPSPWYAVDCSGLLPLEAAGRAHLTARSFRRLLHDRMPEVLQSFPDADPLSRRGPRAPDSPPSPLYRPAGLSVVHPGRALPSIDRLPLDHGVSPVPGVRGGADTGRRRLARFTASILPEYAAGRRHPDTGACSGLSAWLNFGHVSAHEAFVQVCRREGWNRNSLIPARAGQREGFWGMSTSSEAFLDELVTWRELAWNAAAHLPRYRSYASLPAWAQRTLERHADDPRPHLYTLEQLEQAQTHDPIWNAAQRELRTHGRIHNYLRMLWGKKILQWTRSPRQALEFMVALNDRHALDGRNPCSYAGIFWVLGRYDRPWGPERPIFGQVRYMTSESAQRKLRMARYLQRLAP